MNISVKVMKSYDYCHFEVAYGLTDDEVKAECQREKNLTELTDELAIKSQVATDKQIARYKAYKTHIQGMNPFSCDYQIRRIVQGIKNIPESDRTPEMKAFMKARQDYAHYYESKFSYESPGLPPILPEDLKLLIKQLGDISTEPEPPF